MSKDRNAFESTGIKDSRKMRALVVERVDPNMEGRIGVVIPRLMPDADPNLAMAKSTDIPIDKDVVQNTELHGAINNKVSTKNFMWARPERNCTGNFRVPYVGRTVTVYMEDGDPQKLYYTSSGPTLTGETIGMDEVKSSGDVYTPENKPNIHVMEEFKDGTTIYYNENKGTREYHIKFASGFEFSMADHSTANQIELTTTTGHTFVMDQKFKHIRLLTAGGHRVLMDDGNEAINVKVSTVGGHIVDMSDTNKNILVKTTGGHKIDMTDEDAKISVVGSGGGKVIVDGVKVLIN